MSTNFYYFLEKVDSTLIKEYVAERYKMNINVNETESNLEEFKTKPIFREKINLPSIDSLPEEHYARQYIESRKIPQSSYSELYFAEDFKKFVEELEIDKEGLKENDPRIVIPFYNRNKELTMIQGRSLSDSKLRYITVKITDNVKLYGLDKVDESRTIYVLEGPIDSMFIPNSVATADANLASAAQVLDKTKLVLIFDNQPRNKEICRIIDRCIENHFSVVIWPPMVDSKDINDMILDGFTMEEIMEFIEKNTFVNLMAKAQFMNWKKT
jgi:hypothetical protein